MHTDGQFLSTVKNNTNKKYVIRKANEQQVETFLFVCF